MEDLANTGKAWSSAGLLRPEDGLEDGLHNVIAPPTQSETMKPGPQQYREEVGDPDNLRIR